MSDSPSTTLPPSPPTSSVVVAGTSAANARKLINLGWSPTDDGRWTNGTAEPCSVEVALVAVEMVKAPPKTPSSVAAVLTHLASSLQGTAAIGLLMGFVAAVAANPPPEMGLSPTTSSWLKWGIGILATVLLGVQVPMSLKATKKEGE